MENLVNIRLDLGINAQKFVQHVQLYNKNIEDQIQRGIELALNDICENDNFIEKIRESTKIELESIVKKYVVSYELQMKIEKLLLEKISNKVSDYAEKISEIITSSLK